MLENIKFRKPNYRYAFPGEFTTPAALASNNTGLWFFNQKPGESADESAFRCSWNLAKGASNKNIDRRWVGNLPDFQPTYARFRNDTPLLTNISDWTTSGGCFFFIARSDDDTIGTTSVDRAFVLGTYGGNTNFGTGFEFAAESTSVARAIDYNASDGIQTSSIDLGTNPDTLDFEKWRLYFYSSGAVLDVRNLVPADGTTPSTQVTLTGGRRVGSQTLSIGGRLSDSPTIYTPSVHKDIAMVAAFDAVPTTPELVLLTNQFTKVALTLGNTLGSV